MSDEPNLFWALAFVRLHQADSNREVAVALMKELQQQLLTQRTLDRAELLSLLKVCGIEPEGVMSFREDLVRARKYVEALQATVTELISQIRQNEGQSIMRILSTAHDEMAATLTRCQGECTRLTEELRTTRLRLARAEGFP